MNQSNPSSGVQSSQARYTSSAATSRPKNTANGTASGRSTGAAATSRGAGRGERRAGARLREADDGMGRA
jgi:hypothetical protein